MATPADIVLQLEGVRVGVLKGPTVIDAVTLNLQRGKIMCLVGESGSGKTTTALAAFGYCAPNLSIIAGQIAVDGTVVEGAAEFARIRGAEISYVPQNPATALNPSMRVLDAVADTMRGHTAAHVDRHAAALEMLKRVGLPATAEFGARYPHQLSGGQQQRVCIAAALASNPKVVVLDEPTTGLDVTTQARILQELLRLRDEEHVAMLYVTHDLAVAAQVADRVAVMYGGYIMEEGPTDKVLRRPWHPYTRGLMGATPDHVVARALEVMPGAPIDIADRPPGCPFAPRCPQKVQACEADFPVLELKGPNHYVRCPEWVRTDPVPWAAQVAAAEAHAADVTRPVLLEVVDLRAEHRSRGGTVIAVDGISFEIHKSECVALVGESGSGKTTTARVVAGLHRTWSGQVLLNGVALAPQARRRSREQRRRVQIVFQNPADALNPRHNVAEILSRPARTLRGLSRSAATSEVHSLLDAVRLPARYANRYSRELSGGQRQRVAIARALAADPDVIVCDEITSALDVSVQARILELLRDLRHERGVSLLFITHDLGVVATVADEVLVLDHGIICESGKTKALLASPQHEYTKQLLHSAPSLIEAIGAWDASEA
jgi:peptide/nickel transport system ATP-binding protein